MTRYLSILVTLFLLIDCAGTKPEYPMPDPANNYLTALSDQLLLKEKALDGRWPEYTVNGTWQYREKINWLSGFVAGEHWIMYDLTGRDIHREKALEWTERVLPFASIDYTHDMGFIFLPTLVESWERTGDERYKEGIRQAAEMLAKRYNPNGRFIRAWGKLGSQEERAGWMIIDTMMNLELLFKAAEIFHNPEWYRVAYAHALTTLRESFRPDGSTYHVIVFDPQTGKVQKKMTHQGLADETTWARGQAWAISGFSTAYRFTGDERFQEAARIASDYFYAHLQTADGDFVPCWDLSLHAQPGVQKDASAAAVAAMGMYDLADQSRDVESFKVLQKRAQPMVRTLLSAYTTLTSKRPVEEGILAHTVYHFHKQWGVDESYPPGDYYFLKALQKYSQARDRQDLTAALTATSGRLRINADARWGYQPAETGSGKPEMVNLPHTWNAFDVMDSEPGYRRGKGLYTKEIYVPKALKDRRIEISFEAANTYAEVFVNEVLAGSHTGGYLGFSVDITDLLELDATNTIRVAVDNSVNPDIIPSQKSDFFIYGGLTRDAYFDILPAVHILDLQISTPQVSAAEGTVALAVAFDNPLSPLDVKLQVDLSDPAGLVIQHQEFSRSMKTGRGTLELQLDTVQDPQLWHPDNPSLYSVKVSLQGPGQEADALSDRFGFRWYEFMDHGPFLLNGQRLLLRGTHRHEEWAGLGNALPNALHRRDMEMIKEMGANFVRLAHYPQDPEVYQACDELGILVWDELPWCRGGAGGQVWHDNTQRMLGEIIHQNFNHPSIIIWSLGNELYWLPDFEGGDETALLRRELSSLNDLAHQLDPARYTAVRKFYDGDDIVDVFSPSIWAGWYSGVYTNYPDALQKSQRKYKHFLHMEYGGASHVGRHDETPIDGKGLAISDGWEEQVNQAKVQNIAQVGDWSENYVVDLFDYHLMVSESAKDFTGNAQWAFRDFGTPLRPENAIPYVNQKGLLDRQGQPKDAYYVFKSYWTLTPAFCYIESKTWTDREGPKGKARNVSVYSNCGQVELLLNGQSQGRHVRDGDAFPAQGFNWDLQFKEGQNELVAVGFDVLAKETTRDSLKIQYSYTRSGKPADVQLSWADLPNGNVLVTATVVDELGQRCLDYNERMYFWSSSLHRLCEQYGTPTGSSIQECASGKASIEVRSVPGERLLIEARNQDFKGAYLDFTGPLPRYAVEGQ